VRVALRCERGHASGLVHHTLQELQAAIDGRLRQRARRRPSMAATAPALPVSTSLTVAFELRAPATADALRAAGIAAGPLADVLSAKAVAIDHAGGTLVVRAQEAARSETPSPSHRRCTTRGRQWHQLFHVGGARCRGAICTGFGPRPLRPRVGGVRDAAGRSARHGPGGLVLQLDVKTDGRSASRASRRRRRRADPPPAIPATGSRSWCETRSVRVAGGTHARAARRPSARSAAARTMRDSPIYGMPILEVDTSAA
jgi:hypothetical protein